MKKYFEMLGKKMGHAKENIRAYWRRYMNHSKHTKMSEGAQEVNKLITSAHKDQWRRGDK